MLTENQLKMVAEQCGRHSEFGSSPPKGARERQLWGLVEIIDFQCDKYGDAPANVTAEEAREYLLANKAEVLAMTCDPPSYLGVVCSILDFLYDRS